MFSAEEQRALQLSTLAGLSTTLGAVLAVLRQPDDTALAALLGLAVGVMLTLAVAEMWLRTALEHGFAGTTASVALGALLFQLIQPLMPVLGAGEDAGGGGTTGVPRARPPPRGKAPPAGEAPAVGAARRRELLRLGFLMAVTMTLHNMPEGFAVAFASMTGREGFGATVAAAIAAHNIPEGLIVAAPVYAATGSRWRALAIATASGLSEPVGALIALLAARPVMSEALLHHVLACVGGFMGAVCVLELWPEGRKCGAPGRLAAGAVVGTALMLWTLWIGV
jgi:ZIP family zinc transporter